jgi:DNA-binding NtrC family response regulator
MGRTERVALKPLPIRTLRVTAHDAGTSAEGELLTVGTAETNALVLVDPLVSRFHVELRLETNGIRVRDLRSTNGTFVGAIRIDDAVVPPGTVLSVGAQRLTLGDGAIGNADFAPGQRLGGLWGESPSMRRLMGQVERAAQSAVSVHVVGESGTGKEVVAQTLHQLGDRAEKPFEIVDCGTLLPTLVASELFGHERGAFTGADRSHAGAFERASGGTLFIDEVGELPLSVQPALLGALERKRIRRLGGKVDIPVDVRVVSATHRDLRAEINEGRFRLDLYYRLAVVTLRVPALRERRGDIALLVQHFLRESGETRALSELLSPQIIEQLEGQSFPGNVRELRNTIEALLAMGELPESHYVAATGSTVVAGSLPPTYKKARDSVLAAFERAYLPELLRRTQNNVAKAAREADMDRSHLIDLLRRHGLK